MTIFFPVSRLLSSGEIRQVRVLCLSTVIVVWRRGNAVLRFLHRAAVDGRRSHTKVLFLPTTAVDGRRSYTQVSFLPKTAVYGRRTRIEVLFVPKISVDGRSNTQFFFSSQKQMFCPTCSKRNRMCWQAQIEYDYFLTPALTKFFFPISLYWFF